MALVSGLAAQVGWKAETVWDTPVVVDTFGPLVSESMVREVERMESAGIISGKRVLTHDQWAGGMSKVAGDLAFELYNKNQAALWKAIFGAVSGSTYTPGDLSDDSLTVQIGKPGVAGTVHPHTFPGTVVSSWELACAKGEIATLGLSVSARREILVRTVTDGATTNTSAAITSVTGAFTADDVGKPISGTGIPAATTVLSVQSGTAATMSANATATGTGVTFTIGIALAAASYASAQQPIHFVNGVVTIGGSAVQVKKATLSGDNGLDLERYFLGTADHDQPLEAKLREYLIKLDCEFRDETQYRRYLNGTEHAVVLTFAATGGFSLAFTTNARFDGSTPQVAGASILEQNLALKCVGTSTDATAVTAVLTDAS